jgi:hypothetical protein
LCVLFVLPGQAATHQYQTGTVHWSVTHLTGGPERDKIIRADLTAAKGRQWRAYQFPNGVNSDTIRAWWEGVDFARGIDENQRKAVRSLGVQPGVPPIDSEKVRTVTEDGVEVEIDISSTSVRKPDSFFRDNFQEADGRITLYRELARRGRELSIQQASEERGKPKVQLGVGEIPWMETELDALLQLYEQEMQKEKEGQELEKEEGKTMNNKQIKDAMTESNGEAGEIGHYRYYTF